MSATRRAIFKHSTAAAVFLGNSLSAKSQAKTSASESAFNPADWESIRKQFRLDPNFVHMSNFFLASNPDPVRAALEYYRIQLESNPYLYLDDHMFAQEHDKLWKRVATEASGYMGGQADQIALTSSTTMGLALTYNGIKLHRSQEILTTTHEFYPHHESIRLSSLKWGNTFRKISLYEKPSQATADEMIARLAAAIRPETRILGVTWVHSGTGVVLPVVRVGQLVAEVNRKRDEQDRIILVVDGVHGFGVLDQDVAQMGADFFSSGTHKWILGPHGTGVLWGATDSWRLMQPTIPSLMAEEPSAAWRADRAPRGPITASWVSPGGFFAYSNQWATVEAFGFHRQIGRSRVATRILALNQAIKEGLATMPHVTLHTPIARELSAGIICFEVNGMTPDVAVQRLRARGIVGSSSPYGTSYVRLSAGLPNSDEDVNQALREVRALAKV